MTDSFRLPKDNKTFFILTFSYFSPVSCCNDWDRQEELSFIFPGIVSLARCISFVFAKSGPTNSLEERKTEARVPYPLTYLRSTGLVQCLQLHSPDSIDNCGYPLVIVNSKRKSKHITRHSTNSIII